MKAIQKDRYQKSRGTPRVLDVSCEHCFTHIAYYQKDGPGLLKRLYVDRFMDLIPEGDSLTCPDCQRVIGNFYIYEKEKRPAYRIFVGAITKKNVKRSSLDKL